ncbi:MULTISPECIES: hypothetical protein [unclassified Bradyrhizobium]|uniref:hypothetical protein n=1 Tax=unclassified Bradyrhizobium TaxID=2631580 RepID=UPI003393F166
MQIPLIEEVEENLHKLFSKDVIERGAALMRHEAGIYGESRMHAVAENAAMDFIFNIAGIRYPEKAVSPEVHAACKLTTLAISLVTSPKVTSDILAVAIKEIGVLGQRLADRNRTSQAAVASALALDQSEAPTAPAQRQPDDLEQAGNDAQSLLQRIAPTWSPAAAH